jgi:hypothetical protein
MQLARALAPTRTELALLPEEFVFVQNGTSDSETASRPLPPAVVVRASEASAARLLGSDELPGGAAPSIGPTNRQPATRFTRPQILQIPQRASSQHSFELLQLFEGTVTEVGADEFSALLRDLTDRSSPDEVATFDLNEIAEADRPLARPGAVFYWHIGYRTESWGQKSRSSVVSFRRMPAWSRRDLARADALAATWDSLVADE